MAFYAPNIDPVAIRLGFLSIKWYGLSYFIGFIVGHLYIKRILRVQNILFPTSQIENFFSLAACAIIFGGRLAYVIFYEPKRYFENPIEILKIYEGGMSFHGGAIAIIITVYYFCKKNSLEWKILADLIAAAAPIGITLGRIANFINNELYGRVTNMPWAFIFPHTEGHPRHPSQLYEALLEGALLFFILNICIHKGKILRRKGLATGIFSLGYALTRVITECFREPDSQVGFLLRYFTLGQILSLPLLIMGSILVYTSLKNFKNISI